MSIYYLSYIACRGKRNQKSEQILHKSSLVSLHPALRLSNPIVNAIIQRRRHITIKGLITLTINNGSNPSEIKFGVAHPPQSRNKASET
jgi:hypothetical protein